MKKFVCLIFLTGCSFAGTGTGNPQHANSETGGPDATKLTAMVDKVCERISSCHSAAVAAECYDLISEMTEYAAKLGAIEAPAPKLIELIEADRSGARAASVEAIEACQTQVEFLNCSDPAMQNAYDAGLANPFANSAQILAPECTRVFDP